MPQEVMTLRLDRTTRVRLDAAAKRRGLTPSGAARLALESWLKAEDAMVAVSPYEEIKDLVGSVKGGDPSRSTRIGRAVAGTRRRVGRKARAGRRK